MKMIALGMLVALFAVAMVSATNDLGRVRMATEKYHDVNTALADGYTPAPDCAYSSDGTMGVHYYHLGYMSDGILDIEHPEFLLYIPQQKRMRLVAVEYFMPVSQAGGHAPSLFDVTFDGPMAGHFPGMPEHYDLHVWLWQYNPRGLFAQYNPNVHC